MIKPEETKKSYAGDTNMVLEEATGILDTLRGTYRAAAGEEKAAMAEKLTKIAKTVYGIRRDLPLDDGNVEYIFALLEDAYRSGIYELELWAEKEAIDTANAVVVRILGNGDDPVKHWAAHDFLVNLPGHKIKGLSMWALEKSYGMLHEFVETHEFIEDPEGHPEAAKEYPTIRQADEIITTAEGYMQAFHGQDPEKSWKNTTPGATQVRKDINILIMLFYHAGDERKKWSVDTFVNRNRKFVSMVVKKYYASYMGQHYDDMCQEGILAVIEGMEKYNPRLSESGSSTSYFTNPVRHAIVEFLNKETNKTSSAYEAQLVNNVRKALNYFDTYESEKPDKITIGQYTGLTPQQVQIAMTLIERSVPVFQRDEDDKAMSEIPGGENPEAVAIANEENRILYTAMDQLDDDERRVVMMHHGFYDPESTDEWNGQQLDFPKIAGALDIPETRVKRYYNDGMNKLRRDPDLSHVRHMADTSVRSTYGFQYDDESAMDLYDALEEDDENIPEEGEE